MNTAGLAAADTRGLGVAVRILVTDPGALSAAVAILEDDVAALDRACSRFRADSELSAVNDSAGQAVPISPLLSEAIRVALQAASVTSGDVDPTLGAALIRLGYDGDFAGLPADGPPVTAPVHRLGHWTQVELDQDRHTVRLPPGVRLDLGATAKAWCADRVAARVRAALGCGVLVSLGGDIATAGPAPADGWAVRVQDRPGPVEQRPDGPACTVSISSGGLATSTTSARRWRRGGQDLHHLIDPRTGLPAPAPWRTVSVTAPTCLAANTATTAAIIRGPAALDGLHAGRLPARLVDRLGNVTTVNGWPPEPAS